MNARYLTLLWPRDHTTRWVLTGLVLMLATVSALSPDFAGDPRLNPLLTNLSWLGIGAAYGWPIGQRRRWPASFLAPYTVRAQAALTIVLVVTLWGMWRYLTLDVASPLNWSIVAAGVGLWCTSRPNNVFFNLKTAAVFICVAPVFVTTDWLESDVGTAVATIAASLAFIALLMRLSTAYATDPDAVALDAIRRTDQSPRDLAKTLRRAMHIGTKESWFFWSAIVVLTLLILGVTLPVPGTRDRLLTMLFPMWMGGLLILPVLINMNAMRAYNRIWLTGMFRTREIFARAVFVANINCQAGVTFAGTFSLLFAVFIDPDIAVDGASLLMLLHATSLVLLGLSVWTQRDVRKRVPLALGLGFCATLPVMTSYVLIAGGLNSIDPTYQVFGSAAILVVVMGAIVPWTVRMLSLQPHNGNGALPRLPLFSN